MPDTSGKSLEIVTKIVESSAYLNKDISSCPTISKSFRNKLKRYGPLILPCAVPLYPCIARYSCECGSERNEGGICTVCEECAEILVCARDQRNLQMFYLEFKAFSILDILTNNCLKAD